MEEVTARVVADDEPAASVAPKVRVNVTVDPNKADAELRKTKVRVWDNYKVIGDVHTSPKKCIRVAAAVRDGIKYIHLHEFLRSGPNGSLVPGRRGLAFPAEYPELDDKKHIVGMRAPYIDVASLIFEAVDALDTMELFDEEHALYIDKKGK